MGALETLSVAPWAVEHRWRWAPSGPTFQQKGKAPTVPPHGDTTPTLNTFREAV